jgi:hypothetical protein
MDTLMPGRKTFRGRGKYMKGLWEAPELNLTARVVCEKCNNTWMSAIENDHAKPAMKELMAGQVKGLKFTQERANSIALFAFKTVVVLDHLNRGRPVHFFTRQERERFKDKHEIPENVVMFMAAIKADGGGACAVRYYQTREIPNVEIYVCNYFAGSFVFQVVSVHKPGNIALKSKSGFENVAVPFWPKLPDGFVWPAPHALTTRQGFRNFAHRWGPEAPWDDPMTRWERGQK